MVCINNRGILCHKSANYANLHAAYRGHDGESRIFITIRSHSGRTHFVPWDMSLCL